MSRSQLTLSSTLASPHCQLCINVLLVDEDGEKSTGAHKKQKAGKDPIDKQNKPEEERRSYRHWISDHPIITQCGLLS
jgi:hypothetical protein